MRRAPAAVARPSADDVTRAAANIAVRAKSRRSFCAQRAPKGVVSGRRDPDRSLL
jgi:hypothetical protein